LHQQSDCISRRGDYLGFTPALQSGQLASSGLNNAALDRDAGKFIIGNDKIKLAIHNCSSMWKDSGWSQRSTKKYVASRFICPDGKPAPANIPIDTSKYSTSTSLNIVVIDDSLPPSGPLYLAASRT
jgi:hypothetical protein